MRKYLGFGAVVLLFAALAVSGASAGSRATVKLTFATYAWQPTTVAATKSIVETWNRNNPGTQIGRAHV